VGAFEGIIRFINDYKMISVYGEIDIMLLEEGEITGALEEGQEGQEQRKTFASIGRPHRQRHLPTGRLPPDPFSISISEPGDAWR
jgi:hypothetical protein